MDSLFSYAAETDGVMVRVAVSYLADQSEPARGRWFWAYHIRIENHGDQAMKLLTRHWTITDGRGESMLVEGEGVIGEQPEIAPGDRFDYVSGCPLATPAGAMAGHYHMRRADGTECDVAVPGFRLIAPAVGV